MFNLTNNKLNAYIETHLKHPEWFEVFFDKIKNKVKNYNPNFFATTIIKAIKKQIGDKKDIEILGIGSGKGDREIPLLKELIKEGKNISFDYLDIQKEYFEEFANRLNKEKLTQILSQKYIVDWEDFKPEKSYDLVLALHCFYGLKRHTKQSLQKVFNVLKKNGLACIAQSSEEGFIYKLLYEAAGEKLITGKYLVSHLEELGIDYEVQQMKNEIDLGFCVSADDKPISKTAQMFLSYIFSKDYKSFSKKEKQRINKILIRLFKKGNKYISHSASSLIIFRK